MHGSPLRGLSLKSFNFELSQYFFFFIKYKVGHLKEPFILSRIAFCLIKNCGPSYEF